MEKIERKYPVTIHMIVRNEERFVWYALVSVVKFVEKIIIYDTGSEDKTIEIINKFIEKCDRDNSECKIVFEKILIQSADELSKLRGKQIESTATDWFMLLDGDEVWSEKELKKLLDITINDSQKKENVLAVVNHTRNCVGDIWHYLPEKFGRYQFLGQTGHFNIRLMKTKKFELKGTYPDEGFYFQNQLVNGMDDNLVMSKAWYLHASHILRTSISNMTFGRRKKIYSLGIVINRDELPQVFFMKDKPSMIPDVLQKRSLWYSGLSGLADLIRKFK